MRNLQEDVNGWKGVMARLQKDLEDRANRMETKLYYLVQDCRILKHEDRNVVAEYEKERKRCFGRNPFL